MELGTAQLKRSSINSLFRAVHSRHGLAWTDGQNVFLSPISVQKETLKQTTPIKLGEFDAIQSLCWSCDFPGAWCYLCVTQYQKVSIWRVEGTTPNLKLKLVRKISKSPLAQGCLWNPARDILAIATAEQCNLYFRHSDKKSSLALPIQTQHGPLRCACWSDQGDQLYVATKNTLWIFSWSNIDAKMKEFTYEEVHLDGRAGGVLAMVAIGTDYVLMTRELPLDKLLTDESLDVDMARAMESPTDALMNLALGNDTSRSSASLALVATTGSDVKVISETNINGLLTPDLLSYSFDGSMQLVVVGSNTQSTLQFFTISGLGTLDKQHDVMLPDNERPKGLCKAGLSKAVYILIGKLKDTDSTLPSMDKNAEYELKLNLTKLYPSDSLTAKPAQPGGHSNSKINNVAGASPAIEELSSFSGENSASFSGKVNNIVDAEMLVARGLSNSQPQLNTAVKTTGQSQSLVSLNNQSSSSLQAAGQVYSSVDGKLQNDINEEGRLVEGSGARSWRNITRSDDSFVHNQTEQEQTSSSQTTVKRYDAPLAEHSDLEDLSDANLNNLAEALSHQEATISKLRRRIDELSTMLEESHMISVNRYQDLTQPEVACVQFNGVEEKTFLLDRGRLKLDTVKSAFSAPYLVLHLDGLPIVLTANIDGYIPLRFESGNTYSVSCDLVTQGTRRNSSQHQSNTSSEKKSPGTQRSSQSQHFNGLSSDSSSSREFNYADSSKAAPLAATGKAQPAASASTAERLKSIIQNDKSGNAIRKLQAAAAARTGKLPANVLPPTEPVKPPRRGGNKNIKPNNEDHSSFMDVTAAL